MTPVLCTKMTAEPSPAATNTAFAEAAMLFACVALLAVPRLGRGNAVLLSRLTCHTAGLAVPGVPGAPLAAAATSGIVVNKMALVDAAMEFGNNGAAPLVTDSGIRRVCCKEFRSTMEIFSEALFATTKVIGPENA